MRKARSPGQLRSRYTQEMCCYWVLNLENLHKVRLILYGPSECRVSATIQSNISAIW